MSQWVIKTETKGAHGSLIGLGSYLAFPMCQLLLAIREREGWREREDEREHLVMAHQKTQDKYI